MTATCPAKGDEGRKFSGIVKIKIFRGRVGKDPGGNKATNLLFAGGFDLGMVLEQTFAASEVLCNTVSAMFYCLTKISECQIDFADCQNCNITSRQLTGTLLHGMLSNNKHSISPCTCSCLAIYSECDIQSRFTSMSKPLVPGPLKLPMYYLWLGINKRLKDQCRRNSLNKKTILTSARAVVWTEKAKARLRKRGIGSLNH